MKITIITIIITRDGMISLSFLMMILTLKPIANLEDFRDNGRKNVSE